VATQAVTQAQIADYETKADADITAEVALDAYNLGSTAVPTNDVRWLAVLTNETDTAALSALYGTNTLLNIVLTNEAAVRAAADSALSSSAGLTNALFSAWFSGIHNRTSYWDTAYSWGDWPAAVASNAAAIAVLQTNTVTVAGTNGWVTTEHLDWLLSVPSQSYTIITNAPWLSNFSTMTASDIIAAGGATNTVTDHAALSNLTWTASGHSGTPARLAGFFEGGAAGESYLGAGLYFGGSDELSVSNEIIAGAALGASALQPADTNGFEVGSHGAFVTTNQLTDATATPRVIWDSVETNRWWVLAGTNAVQYELGALTTNYTVTLSDNFEETVTHTRPAWTNNVWPFTDGLWKTYGPGLGSVIIVYNDDNSTGWGGVDYEFPSILTPGENAQGTATVSHHIAYATNETRRVILLESIPTNLVTDDDLAAVSGALGTHTNDAPAHVSAADRVKWDAGITNGQTGVTFGTVNGFAYVPIMVGTTNELPLVANRTNGVLYVEIP